MRHLLPALRDIGFHLWDPLGLCATWQEGEAMADEYDSYLMRAYSAAVNGKEREVICVVLRQAEVAMGLPDAGMTDRHMTVAQAILALLAGELAQQKTEFL